jgi:tellurium resistance protein TerZ
VTGLGCKIGPAVTKIAFVLNSFRGQDFKTIPFASIRIYEGTSSRVNEVFATYDIANGPNFAGHVSMVMGVFYKKNGEWKFNAIGEPTPDKDLKGTLNSVVNKYL